MKICNMTLIIFSAEAALWLIFNSGARSLKRKWAISINAFKTLVYPFQVIDLESLFHPIQNSLKAATCTCINSIYNFSWK